MSQGFRSYEGVNSVRPLIPRAFSPLPMIPMNLQGQATLNQMFDTYARLVRDNNILSNQLRLINSERQGLSQRFQQMKNEQDRKKRHRRTAQEINRSFECPIQTCKKSYGSDGSLLQHIKIKHNDFYQSDDYEKLLLSKQKKRQQQPHEGSDS